MIEDAWVWTVFVFLLLLEPSGEVKHTIGSSA